MASCGESVLLLEAAQAEWEILAAEDSFLCSLPRPGRHKTFSPESKRRRKEDDDERKGKSNSRKSRKLLKRG